MALIKCAECGHDVSSDAKTCPGCGTAKFVPKKKGGAAVWIVGSVIVLGIAGFAKQGDAPATAAVAQPAAAPAKPNPERDKQMQQAGAGALALKRAAKDPTAFELTSANLMPDGTACYEYRAKNSFGAIMPGSALKTAKGKLLVQEHDGNTFVAAWNKACTKSGGTDLAPLMKRLDII